MGVAVVSGTRKGSLFEWEKGLIGNANRFGSQIEVVFSPKRVAK
jgi:hypothetical protein